MNLNWDDLHDEAYFHFLHENSKVSEKFDSLCKESVEVIFNSLDNEQKEKMLKHHIFKQMREQSSPKTLFLILESIGRKDLIDKHSLSPEDFIQKNPPHKSWILNKKTGHYDPPIQNPNDGKKYKWNEIETRWVEVNEWEWEDLPLQSNEKKITYNQKRKERMEICSKCEYNNKNMCIQCGCIIPLKTAAPWMSCPVNKWGSMWSDNEKQ